MKRRGIAGSIVMTASMSGSIANKGEPAVQIFSMPSSIDVLIPDCLPAPRNIKGLTCLAYNTSKSALLQMCRSAAAEWGQYGIRVNVSPGSCTVTRKSLRTLHSDTTCLVLIGSPAVDLVPRLHPYGHDRRSPRHPSRPRRRMATRLDARPSFYP